MAFRCFDPVKQVSFNCLKQFVIKFLYLDQCGQPDSKHECGIWVVLMENRPFTQLLQVSTPRVSNGVWFVSVRDLNVVAIVDWDTEFLNVTVSRSCDRAKFS